MATLLKTCKTFHLSNTLPWKDIKTRVEGVKFLDDRRAVMVFHGMATKQTTFMGFKDLALVRTCSFYDKSDAGGKDEDEEVMLRAIVKASKTTRISITSLAYEYSVFRVSVDGHIVVHKLYDLLVSLGANAHMESQLYNALLITDDKVVWSISDSFPQKVLAQVTGVGPSEARRLVNRSRVTMKLF